MNIDNNGDSLFIFTPQNEKLETVKCLTEQRSDTNKNNKYNNVSFILSSQNWHIKILKYLIKQITIKIKHK